MRISERAYQLRKELFPALDGHAAAVVEEQIVRTMKDVRKDALSDARDRLKGMNEFEIGRMIEEDPE